MSKRTINNDLSYYDVVINSYPTPVELIYKIYSTNIQEYIKTLCNEFNVDTKSIQEIKVYKMIKYNGRTRSTFILSQRYTGTLLKTAITIYKRKNK